jgi:hypothetical protein
MALVSLVIVSHSLTLARGVKEMADQMADQQVQIEIAAGLVDERSGATVLGRGHSTLLDLCRGFGAGRSGQCGSQRRVGYRIAATTPTTILSD